MAYMDTLLYLQQVFKVTSKPAMLSEWHRGNVLKDASTCKALSIMVTVCDYSKIHSVYTQHAVSEIL